jgi:hypothetical protein
MIPIAFGHRKRVGKDTAAKFLISHLRTTGSKASIHKVSFAYEIKRIAHELYSWAGLEEPEYYERNDGSRSLILPKIGKSPRDIWIDIGMAFRDIYPMTWVEACFRNHSGADIVVISDCRFPNEADYIKERGGFVVKVIRPEIEDTSDVADDAMADYDDWSYTITNTELGAFYKEIVKFADYANLSTI